MSYVSGADFRKQVRSHFTSFLITLFLCCAYIRCVAVHVLVNDVLKTKMLVCCVMPCRNIQLKLPLLDKLTLRYNYVNNCDYNKIYIYKKYSLFLHETMYTHIYIKYISVTHEDNAYVNSYNEIIQHFDMLKFSFLWIAYGCNMLCGLRRRSWLFNGTAWCRHRRCVYH